ncbi:Dynactin subunit 5 [Ceratobasidium theobromae]|uniref:Dynactin subunit 5 n=1 Tax=Ceratobasidium theobromae TaxID=1582974 RepID=A0A5N5QNC0_9AGAM|nr:Dynactin subunit 5 [Ceratobasidium theobromae]
MPAPSQLGGSPSGGCIVYYPDFDPPPTQPLPAPFLLAHFRSGTHNNQAWTWGNSPSGFTSFLVCQRNIQSILANHRIDSVVQTAWVLLLLVSLSLPIIKPLYILEVESKVTPSIQTSIATSIRFGVWGMCLGAYEFGPSGATWNDAGVCSKPRLGYSVDDAVLQLTGQKDLAKIALQALMGILILHPIACGLVLLSLIASLVTTWHPVRALNVTSLIAVILSAVSATVVFVIDIILIPIARNKIEEATNNKLTVVFGNAAWMTMGAVIALWLGVIGASIIACGCFGCGKRRGRRAKKHQYAEKLHSLDNGSSESETQERADAPPPQYTSNMSAPEFGHSILDIVSRSFITIFMTYSGLNQQVVRLWALVKAHTSPNNVVGRLSFADNDEQPTCDALQQAQDTGNKVSRRATIAGPQNIILGGKTIISSGAIIRGDLRRTGAGSAVVISLGRYCLISDSCIMRPPYKTYRGNFNYYPMKIGDHVHIGAGTVVEAATIGNHVEIGKNCGKFTIIKDCAKIDDNSIVPPNTVIPALARFGGSPAQFIEELPESTMENVEVYTKGYYARFQPQEQAN